MKKILLPTDGSENAHRAGEYAIAEADLGADIIVLYVIDIDYLNALPQQDLRKKLENGLKKEGEKEIQEFKQKLEDTQCEGHCKNVNLITMIKEGKPADVILKTIDEEGIDQVIMGKSGKHGIEKLILGSTADRVVRGAKVPVNVIS
ncbi:universal stress protein [Methanobacterium oryzae]|uniref:universal stress protein n=1 Tax=Methanobacterium oryzae TaxID=69540 RepID=UPI003D1DE2C0